MCFYSVRLFFYTMHRPSRFLQGKGDGMKEEWIAYIVKQTLQGLKYFHDQGQVIVYLFCPSPGFIALFQARQALQAHVDALLFHHLVLFQLMMQATP